MEEDCIFCKIVDKKIPAEIVYENNNTIAFLDISPASKGHTLVISKKHSKIISDMADKDLNDLILTVKNLSSILLKFNKGVNLVQSNGKEAGQEVFHVHFHLIPRSENDNLDVGRWNSHKYKDEKERKAVANKIRSFV